MAKHRTKTRQRERLSVIETVKNLQKSRCRERQRRSESRLYSTTDFKGHQIHSSRQIHNPSAVRHAHKTRLERNRAVQGEGGQHDNVFDGWDESQFEGDFDESERQSGAWHLNETNEAKYKAELAPFGLDDFQRVEETISPNSNQRKGENFINQLDEARAFSDLLPLLAVAAVEQTMPSCKCIDVDFQPFKVYCIDLLGISTIVLQHVLIFVQQNARSDISTNALVVIGWQD